MRVGVGVRVGARARVKDGARVKVGARVGWGRGKPNPNHGSNPQITSLALAAHDVEDAGRQDLA